MSLTVGEQSATTGGDLRALLESPRPQNSGGVAGAQFERAMFYAPSAAVKKALVSNGLWCCIAVQIGSVGIVTPVQGYALYVPHFGTSPVVSDYRTSSRAVESMVLAKQRRHTRVRDMQALSGAEQALEILAAFALNKSQLAEILRVSRPTLYDWLSGKEPNLENQERLEALLALLSRAEVSASAPLNARFVRKPIDLGRKPLLEELRAERWDEGRIVELVREARELSIHLESKRIDREGRLRALGYEDPSEDERRKLLERNLAMRDWPK